MSVSLYLEKMTDEELHTLMNEVKALLDAQNDAIAWQNHAGDGPRPSAWVVITGLATIAARMVMHEGAPPEVSRELRGIYLRRLAYRDDKNQEPIPEQHG